MSIEEALVSRLKTLVTAVGSRVVFAVADQEIATPFLVYSIATDLRGYTLQGASGLTQTHFLLKIYAEQLSTANEVSTQLLSAMESWPASDIKISGVFARNKTNGKDPDSDLRFIHQYYEVHHNY